MSKILKIGIALLVIIGLVVVGVKKLKEKREANSNAPQAKIYPIVVDSFSPKMKKVRLTLPYLAEVANDKDVKLSSRIAARILKIKRSGSVVKKGDIVVELDTTNIKSSLASVKEQLQAASLSLKNLKATHQRTLDLLKVQGASIEESQKETSMIATAEAALVSLKQKKIELKNSLSYAQIISPVDGTISKTFSNVGALSGPGKPLVAISSENGFYLMVRIPNDLPIIGVIFEGTEYSATALGSTYHGLSEYKVYVGDKKLISGDRVEVDVITLEQNAMLLPFDTLLNRDAKEYVLVINGNKADPKEVHIIQSAEQGVVVSENLEGKNLVVAKPDILLRLVSAYLLKVKE
jgi:multidrug efflux pump subunit AcrA (membrane-fusion protein)